MSGDRVSIAMATFDGGRFVGEQLASFREQTRLPDELVVFDDGSTDDTVEQLASFACDAPFEVRIERNDTRLSSTPNFEKAISLCTGDVIFLADQDDIWMPQKIERLCNAFAAAPEVGCIFSNGTVVDAELRPRSGDFWQALFFSPAEQSLVREGRAVEVVLKHAVAAGTTMAFRAVYRDLALPFPALRDCHDSWIAFLIACVSGVEIVDEALIRYRVHGANQFGIHKLSIREQIEEARKQLRVGAFAYAVDFFTAARERLESDPSRRVSPDTLRRVGEKIDHSRVRNEMSDRGFSRLAGIARETLSGRYGRYSYGIKSIAQDVFLR